MWLIYGLLAVICYLSFTLSTLILISSISPVGVTTTNVNSHATGIMLRLASLACNPT